MQNPGDGSRMFLRNLGIFYSMMSILKEGFITRIQYRQHSAPKLSQEASAVAKYCNSKRTPFTFIFKSAGCFRRNQDLTPTHIPIISVYSQILV
jgi:hypothetical protein